MQELILQLPWVTTRTCKARWARGGHERPFARRTSFLSTFFSKGDRQSSKDGREPTIVLLCASVSQSICIIRSPEHVFAVTKGWSWTGRGNIAAGRNHGVPKGFVDQVFADLRMMVIWVSW